MARSSSGGGGPAVAQGEQAGGVAGQPPVRDGARAQEVPRGIHAGGVVCGRHVSARRDAVGPLEGWRIRPQGLVDLGLGPGVVAGELVGRGVLRRGERAVGPREPAEREVERAARARLEVSGVRALRRVEEGERDPRLVGKDLLGVGQAPRRVGRIPEEPAVQRWSSTH